MSQTDAPVAEPMIEVSDEAFEYLVLQAGAISDLRHDRAAWLHGYRSSIFGDFENMRRGWLPRSADRVLDIGSGLGGVDILLARHYRQPEIRLVDGCDDAPVVIRHAKTFNNMDVARKFLRANGVRTVTTISPALEEPPAPCDLIISLRSWCFHYAPEVYLDYARECCKPGTVLIIDVRADYKTWRRVLEDAFGKAQDRIDHGAKFDRLVFKV